MSKGKHNINVFYYEYNFLYDLKYSCKNSAVLADSPSISLSLQTQNVRRRERRQTIGSIDYANPVVTDLSASQHCQGIYLRWKRPPFPVR